MLADTHTYERAEVIDLILKGAVNGVSVEWSLTEMGRLMGQKRIF